MVFRFDAILALPGLFQKITSFFVIGFRTLTCKHTPYIETSRHKSERFLILQHCLPQLNSGATGDVLDRKTRKRAISIMVSDEIFVQDDFIFSDDVFEHKLFQRSFQNSKSY
jgi:hypothetical protein